MCVLADSSSSDVFVTPLTLSKITATKSATKMNWQMKKNSMKNTAPKGSLTIDPQSGSSYGVLQCGVVSCGELQCVAGCCRVLFIENTTPRGSLTIDAQNGNSCNTLYNTIIHCDTVQHSATQCNTVQHTATHCNFHETQTPKGSLRVDAQSGNFYLVLQRVAVCCRVLHCVAVCCGVLQCAAVYCSVLQCIAVCCSVLQCVAVCCSVLQCVAVC